MTCGNSVAIHLNPSVVDGLMTRRTSITLDSDQKERLAEAKPDGQNWGAFLIELLENQADDASSADELETIHEEHREILNAIDQLPERLRSELR
jgi:DNA-directed RNA polymerase specialized sigma24 family protein